MGQNENIIFSAIMCLRVCLQKIHGLSGRMGAKRGACQHVAVFRNQIQKNMVDPNHSVSHLYHKTLSLVIIALSNPPSRVLRLVKRPSFYELLL
jgi:hypothetical protein